MWASAGIWRCPPGETYAETVDLSYRLRSSAEYHPHYIQNVKTLQDYWAHPVPQNREQESLVLESLDAYPGVSVAELLRAHPGLPVDILWAMLSTCLIFTDLEAALLIEHEHVFLYQSEAELIQAKAQASSVVTLRAVAAPLVFDTRFWQAEIRDEVVILQPELGMPLSLPVSDSTILLSAGK